MSFAFTRQTTAPEYALPQPAKPRSIPKCGACRRSKTKCLFDEGNPWPAKCRWCKTQKVECSKPRLAPDKRGMGLESTIQNPPADFHHSHCNQSRLVKKEPQLQERKSTPLPASRPIQHQNADGLLKDVKQAIFLLGLHEIVMMALKELRVLAVEMIQPFKDDPHVNRLDACIPRMSEIEVEIKSFARALMSKMETLGCNSFLTKAQIVLARRYHQNELTWYTDDYSAYEARESITFYRQHGHAVFAHALQLKFFLEQPVISESDIIEFAACRTQSLEDFAQFESHGLVVIPATFLGSQLFLPKTFIRNPSIYKLVAGDKRLDCLGRTVSHLCHDDGLDIDWLQNHVNHADILDRTALYLACYAGKEGHVQKLLGMGARSDQRALNGLLPLQVAAIRCSDLQNMCRNHLMHSPEKSAETSAQIIIDRSPVLWAAFSGNLPAIKTLMGRIGSTTKVRDNLDCTPIGLAACMGHTEVVTFLLLNGFERDHPDKRGRTPFWYAARYSRLDIMKLLIPLVQIDKEDNDGTTPLAAAARFNCTEAVALLLESSRLYGKLNLTAKDNIDLSPFIKAALGGSTGCLKLLLKHEPLALDNIVVEKLFEIALNSEDTGLLHFVRRNFKVWSIPRVMHHKPLAYPCEAGFEGFKSMSNIINSFSFV